MKKELIVGKNYKNPRTKLVRKILKISKQGEVKYEKKDGTYGYCMTPAFKRWTMGLDA